MGYKVKLQKVNRPTNNTFFVTVPVVLVETMELMKGEESSQPEECYFWQAWNNSKRPFVSAEDLIREVPHQMLVEAIERTEHPSKLDFRSIFQI